MELELSLLNRSVVHVNTAHAVLTTCVMCTMTAIQDTTEMQLTDEDGASCLNTSAMVWKGNWQALAGVGGAGSEVH